jgi:hypothetical protein
MIIGISGYSGSGKDLVGTIIQEISLNKWHIKKWAGKLKTIASILTGIPVENFEDQEFKKTLLGPEWGTVKDIPLNGVPVFADIQFNSLMTVRDFLQKLGTDAIRDSLHENTWVNATMIDYKKESSECGISKIGTIVNCVDYPNWIITDTRFPNEAEAIKKAGGIVIRINRPGVQPINPHPSETSLDDWSFDAVINNDGDVSDIVHKVGLLLYRHNIK